MDGGGSMRSNEERVAERLMDDYLKTIGLHRKKIAKDGSCLFRAVAEQVLYCQSFHTEVRAQCVGFLKKNRESYEAFIEGDFEDYLCKLQDPQQWVGEVEINALAVIYKRDFLIYQEPNKPAVHITDNNFKDKVRLCFLNGNHYDSVYPISHMKGAAVCQSILYELLYSDVFKVDRSLLVSCQRIARPSDLLSDDSMAACISSDESDVDSTEVQRLDNGASTTTTKSRGRGRGRHLSDRVRRSLNPTLFRNIELDVWQRTKKAQQKLDFCIAAGMQYAVGDRCQVLLEGSGRSYNAAIKEVSPSSGPVTVYIEELGRRQVPLWSLRPLNEDSSWSFVNRDKRVGNGHGEWEQRGRGRGRGRSTTTASSVTQATAALPGGRVLKRQSWPTQATVEESGGSRGSKKSVSTAESASFGLSEEERLAKEEEERNVALVEIQLRDEHSFPALSAHLAHNEGGKKKGGEKKRSQQSVKMMSPVEDLKAPSPPAGEQPKSVTPPQTAPPKATPTVPSPPTAASLNPTPGTGMNVVSTAATDTTAVSSFPADFAPPTKTNALSYASAASGVPHSPPAAAAAIIKPPVTASIPSSTSCFAFVTPVLPAASSSPPISSSHKPPTASSSAFLPPTSSPSPVVSTPTFIAPIAPSPVTAQGFVPARISPPLAPLPHSPSPPVSSTQISSSSSSSSLICHARQVDEAPPPPVHPKNCLSNSGAVLTASQPSQNEVSQSQSQNQIHNSVLQNQNQISESQMQNQSQAALPQSQVFMPHVQASVSHQAQSEVASLRQIQVQPHCPSKSQSEPVQSSHLSTMPSSTPQTSVQIIASDQLHPHPPHPSQVPLPSQSLSTSVTIPSLPTQAPTTDNQTEVPPPPVHPGSPAHPPSQQSVPPPPSHHPQFQPVHTSPPQHQSVQGTVPLQQLSQLYLDPLYPGFPQKKTGEPALPPPFSTNKSGDDLPQDVSLLRFFFNLGVKAYSMPMLYPYVYLFPLQHAYAVQPKPPSRSPSPNPLCHLSSAPTGHHEPYPSVSPQFDHSSTQAPPTEPAHPTEGAYTQGGYPHLSQPPSRTLPCPPPLWHHHQMQTHRNPSYPVVYPTPQLLSYTTPPPSSQCYLPGPTLGHPMYPPAVAQYSSLEFQSSSGPEELQVNQGVMEPLQPANGDTMPGFRSAQGSGPQEGSASGNVANENSGRPSALPGVSDFGPPRKEEGERLTRQMFAVDPSHNTPVVMGPDSPVLYNLMSKTVPDNNPSHSYRSQHNPANRNTAFTPHRGPEALSVSCSTEDNWDEPEDFRQPVQNYRAQRKGYRGRGGRNSRRRPGGEGGARYHNTQFIYRHRQRTYYEEGHPQM